MLGTHLTILIGSTIPRPAPARLTDALEQVTVTHSDRGRSGFQMTLNAGRGGARGVLDYPLLEGSLLQPFNRVMLIVTLGAHPQVLFDGVIADIQLMPSNQAGQSRISVTGEDISLMMDLKQTVTSHTGLADTAAVELVLAEYAHYGVVPEVIKAPVLDEPLPTERIPIQHDTDLGFIQKKAAIYGYVFYVTPGPLPEANQAYWGPPRRVGIPQKALTMNLGEATNVESLNFRYNALAPEEVQTLLDDSTTDAVVPEVAMTPETRLPPLSLRPGLEAQAHVRERWLSRTQGLNVMQARAKAQGMTDRSLDQVVMGYGTMDAARYGTILWARRPVGVRGVGASYDGLYYVQSVTHTLQLVGEKSYKQDFTITRDGLTTTVPGVRV